MNNLPDHPSVPSVLSVVKSNRRDTGRARIHGTPATYSYSATRYSYSCSYSIPAEPIEYEDEYRFAEYEYDRACVLRTTRGAGAPRSRGRMAQLNQLPSDEETA